MSSRPVRPPAYRLHKPSGQAVVRLGGKDRYLGRHGTDSSKEAYRRIIAEWLVAGPARARKSGEGPECGATVEDLIVAYWDRHVSTYYIKDGEPTSEQDNIRQALRFLRKVYGTTVAREFGPLALKAVRRSMIEAGRCRTLINKDVHRVRGLFRWAASEELFPGAAYQSLRAVAALERGRSDAKERGPVGEVPEAVVRSTLPHMSPRVAAMVELQLLTAARPGEVAAIRPCDVDRSDPACWVYRPESHKAQHHGRERLILIGPRAQVVLGPWLERGPDEYCFDTGARVGRRGEGRSGARAVIDAAGRMTIGPRRGGRYTKDSYRVAVARACDRAFPHPTLAGIAPRDLTDDRRAELRDWRRRHRWHPHQLRRARATAIRRDFDIEAAQIILGHSKPDTTLIYAERDLSKARAVVALIG